MIQKRLEKLKDGPYLQNDVNMLNVWQMLFIFGKCTCLHTGHGNEDVQNTMGGIVLNTTVNDRDLGLPISAEMKVSE